MEENQITSRKNPLVRAAAQLKESAVRRAQGKFLCEGARLCRDAAASGVQILQCFYTLRAQTRYRAYLEEILPAAREDWVIGESVAELLTDTRANQGIFCVCGVPAGLSASGGFAPTGPCLVLETLQDPGNLGTVLRTAEALGVTEIVLLGDCCDPLSPKVLRACMGAVFRIQLHMEEDAGALCELLRRRGYACHAASPDRTATPVTEIDFSTGRHAVFIGNEGSGLTAETIRACGSRVTIPMGGRAESLNASAAATVLLWELQRAAAARREESHG